jgi:anti-sigma B factor antagonist
MFDIQEGANQELILSGRFDASQVERARGIFLSLNEGKTLNFAQLDYISSAGLGVLLAAQKRLSQRGQALRLINVNPHIRDVFRFSGFDQIFEIA